MTECIWALLVLAVMGIGASRLPGAPLPQELSEQADLITTTIKDLGNTVFMLPLLVIWWLVQLTGFLALRHARNVVILAFVSGLVTICADWSWLDPLLQALERLAEIIWPSNETAAAAPLECLEPTYGAA